MTSFVAIVVSNAVIAALLALVTLLVTRFWRSPQLAHGLWLLVLLKLITPPLVTVSPPSEWLAQSAESAEPSRAASVNVVNPVRDVDDVADAAFEASIELDSLAESNVDTAELTVPLEIALPDPLPLDDVHASPTKSDDFGSAPDPESLPWDAATAHWQTAMSLVWMAGCVAYFALLVWRCVSFRRLLSRSAPAHADILDLAARLALKLGLRRRPTIRIMDAAIPPLVWSLGLRPWIVLPQRLLAELSPAQCEALVAHELAHIRRRDDLVRWLEVFALVFWWWNPVAWFARRKLREAEEECCDAWVVWALPGERRSYGEAMLATIDFLTDGPKLPALAESAFGSSFCKRRIEMIMKRNVNCKISWAALGLIVLTAMAVLPVVAQTSQPENKQNEVRGEDGGSVIDVTAATSEDAAASAPDDGGNIDDPAAEPSSGDSLPKRISTLERALGQISGDSSIATAAFSDDLSQRALLAKVKQLEESLESLKETLENGRGTMENGTSSATAVWPRLPNFEVSPNEREQELQEQLLKLDIVAARSEIEQARIVYEKSVELNKNRPGTVADIEVRGQQAAWRAKEIQLQRAEIILELFKQQAQRKREETARFRRYQQGRPRQETPSQAEQNAQTRAYIDSNVKAFRRDELARLKTQHEHVANELARLENLLKEAPESRETWEAVNRFLKIYRNLAAPDATDEAESGSRGGARP